MLIAGLKGRFWLHGMKYSTYMADECMDHDRSYGRAHCGRVEHHDDVIVVVILALLERNRRSGMECFHVAGRETA